MESTIKPTDGCPGRIGQVGMIAALRGVKPSEVGKLVLVRHPVGLQPDPRQRGGEAFHWQVLALGAEVILNGRPCRDLVVPDDCLSPVSQVEPRQVERLVKKQARMDFDAAAADLARYLNKHPMTGEELEACMERVGELTVFEHILQVVPVATAIAELGFVSTDDGQTWDWSACHGGAVLKVFGTADLFGRWTLTASMRTADTVMWDEQGLESQVQRGTVLALLRAFWRGAFGAAAPLPSSLAAAEIVDRHRRDLSNLKLGSPPALHVEGSTLRAVRRLLADKWGLVEYEAGPPPDVPVHLSFDGDLLKIRVQDFQVGVQANGLWVDDCRVSLRELLAVPPWRLRGGRVTLSQLPAGIAVSRHNVPHWPESDSHAYDSAG